MWVWVEDKARGHMLHDLYKHTYTIDTAYTYTYMRSFI